MRNGTSCRKSDGRRANEEGPERLEESVGQRLCEQICDLVGCLNVLEFGDSRFSQVAKVMIF